VVGYGLPPDALSWVDPEDRDAFHEPDAFGRRGPLPTPRYVLALPGTGAPPPTPLEQQPRVNESAPGLLRTALCVETRGGILHVFTPPTHDADSYIELVAAIERAASSVGTPVRIEGYPPP